MAGKKKLEREALREGTVFNPKTVGVGYRVEFEYEKGCAFTVELRKDGTLGVRTGGGHSDLIATHHHVSNDVTLVARRWNNDLMRFVDFIIPEAK